MVLAERPKALYVSNGKMACWIPRVFYDPTKSIMVQDQVNRLLDCATKTDAQARQDVADFSAKHNKMANTYRTPDYDIKICIDALSKQNRYSVTTTNGDPLWYGKEFQPSKSQGVADYQTAGKAIFITAEVMKELPAEAKVKLTIYTTNKYMATNRDNAKRLFSQAEKNNIALHITHIPQGKNNPASKFIFQKGFNQWREGIANLTGDMEKLKAVNPLATDPVKNEPVVKNTPQMDDAEADKFAKVMDDIASDDVKGKKPTKKSSVKKMPKDKTNTSKTPKAGFKHKGVAKGVSQAKKRGG